MTDKKEKSIQIRTVSSTDSTIDSLVNQSMGLYFPLNQLTQEQRAKMEAFLKELDFEPIAVAHSKATDDD